MDAPRPFQETPFMSPSTHLSQSAFHQEIRNLSERLRRFVESSVSGFDAAPGATARRRARVMHDFRFFAKTYFPHYVSPHDSVLHTFLYDELPPMLDAHQGIKLALAAPRGEAKSTLVTQIFTLWSVLTGRKRFIPIIMDAHHQACAMLAAIKVELESNPRLGQDFPEECGQGRMWREDLIITSGNARLQAFGSGERMRGLRHGPHRPDLVICDDLENDENVRSAIQRDKLEEWLNKTVLKLGPPDDSLDVIYIGTLLHHDSVLARTLRNPLWRQRRFQALLSWPEEMKLWDQWENLLRDEGEACADAFFAAHRTAMEAGAQLSWPQVRGLEQLMKIRFRDGHAAFDAELQNQPLEGNATFSDLLYWVRPNPEWMFFGAVDPSMGRSGNRGDPSAILVGGYDRLTGILDVVEADIRRRPPDRIIEDVIALQMQYDCRLWVVESVQFQEFFKDELVRRSALRGVPVPARGVKPVGDKTLRIQGLQPHIQNGLIRFHPRLGELLRQLRHWGEADTHDDGPDALHMLWKLALDGAMGQGNVLSTGRRGSLEGWDDKAARGNFSRAGFGTVRGGLTLEGY